MPPGRMIGCSLLAAVLVLAASSLPAQSDSAKRRPAAPATDPFAAARAQIARLRQTADQLRLLANQPVSPNLPGEARAELAQHERWLRRAESRITVLADQWEQRLLPLAESGAHGKAVDLNAFFEAQSAVLRSKLRGESARQNLASPRVRSSRDTAQIVIDSTMY